MQTQPNQVQAADDQTEIKALRAEIQALRSEISGLHSLLTAAPEPDTEYSSLAQLAAVFPELSPEEQEIADRLAFERAHYAFDSVDLPTVAPKPTLSERLAAETELIVKDVIEIFKAPAKLFQMLAKAIR